MIIADQATETSEDRDLSLYESKKQYLSKYVTRRRCVGEKLR